VQHSPLAPEIDAHCTPLSQLFRLNVVLIDELPSFLGSHSWCAAVGTHLKRSAPLLLVPKHGMYVWITDLLCDSRRGGAIQVVVIP
jgi:hypothetical protein